MYYGKSRHLNAQNKTVKYFLKIKGQSHNIFKLPTNWTRQNGNINLNWSSTSISVSTLESLSIKCLFHPLLLCQNHRFSLLYWLDMLTNLYQYIKTTITILLIFGGGTYWGVVLILRILLFKGVFLREGCILESGCSLDYLL